MFSHTLTFMTEVTEIAEYASIGALDTLSYGEIYSFMMISAFKDIKCGHFACSAVNSSARIIL